MQRLILVTLLAAGVVHTGAASAQKKVKDEARTQFHEGVELYKEGQYEQAAIAFERAYELQPSFKILFNVAQSQNQLGHYAAALEAYTRYLAEGGKDVSAERAEQVEVELERLRALVGSISVRHDAGGATVFIDGRRAGDTPLPGPVFTDLGEHEVLVKLDGETLHREIVKVAGGLEVAVVVEAAKPKPAAPAAVTQASPAQAAAGAPEETRAPDRVWTWVALGVGAAAGVGAAVTGGLAASYDSDLESGCPDGACPESRWDDLDRARTVATATDVLIGVAAVGAAAAITLWFVEPMFGGEAEGAVAVGVGPGAFTVGGRF